jgi:two-component system, NtrC family, sensor kinase
MGTANHAAASLPQEPAATDGPADGEAKTAALVARLRQQLSSGEAIASIGRMTAGVAQELNNPLTALLTSLSLMRDVVGGEAGPKSPDDIARLRTALVDCVSVTDRIKDLVGAVRAISQRDHRSAVFFDPARAIRNATKVFAVVHRSVCRVDVTIAGLPALHGSPAGLGQVVLNLLQNGLDASLELQHEGHARLTVAATVADSEVQIAVSDDGAGIATEIAPRVFEEFFTSKDTDNRSGLGLYLSRKIVTEMRGSIAFDSVPGKTVFTVRLPFGD